MRDLRDDLTLDHRLFLSVGLIMSLVNFFNLVVSRNSGIWVYTAEYQRYDRVV